MLAISGAEISTQERQVIRKMAFHRDPNLWLRSNLVQLPFLAAAALGSYWVFQQDQPWTMWPWLVLVFFLTQLNFYGVLATAVASLAWGIRDPEVQISLVPFVFLPATYYVSIHFAVLMHNAAHTNFRPRWLNRLIGEICGFLQGMGFLGWKVAHGIHHQCPDDSFWDVHPPLKEPFWKFLGQMKVMIIKGLGRNYRWAFGDVSATRRRWGMTVVSIAAANYLRFLTLFMILGPADFIAFFLPFLLFHLLFYAHFNYFTHRPLGEGQYEILNVDHGLYKLHNRLFLSPFFHKTHHLKPFLVNPGRAPMPRKVLIPPHP